MTAFCKIFSYPGNPRVNKALIAAKLNGLEVEVPAFQMGVDNKTPEFLAKFPLGKVPVMECGDGACLFESDAILHHIAKGSDKGKLFGQTSTHESEVIQWMCFASNELATPCLFWLYPTMGFVPVSKEWLDISTTQVLRAFEALNKVLLHKTYLVGEAITLADVSVFTLLAVYFEKFITPEERKTYGNLTRYFKTLAEHPAFKAVYPTIDYATARIKTEAPKKEAAPAAKPVAAAAPVKSSFNLEEWKRYYSNHETRPDAINWFWEHFDAENFSIWRCDYKYNDELSLLFMSNNLIGGFFQRLEATRKKGFGCLVVCGEDRNNTIGGYFVFAGQEIPVETEHCADMDSYQFTKVDPQEHRERFNDTIAWEGPSLKDFADGKVFK